jgi:hypothetical protein
MRLLSLLSILAVSILPVEAQTAPQNPPDLTGTYMGLNSRRSVKLPPEIPSQRRPASQGGGPGGGGLPLTQWAKDNTKQIRLEESAASLCLPNSLNANSSFFSSEIIQTPRQVTILPERQELGVRRIYMDGRPHPKDFDPSYVGHSIGHWEGDTLVVDTVGFKPRAILLQEGVPHGEDARVEERFRLIASGKYLEHRLTVIDPKALTEPVTRVDYGEKIEGMEIQEYICNENLAPYSYLEKFQELAPGRGGNQRPQPPPAAAPVP